MIALENYAAEITSFLNYSSVLPSQNASFINPLKTTKQTCSLIHLKPLSNTIAQFLVTKIGTTTWCGRKCLCICIVWNIQYLCTVHTYMLLICCKIKMADQLRTIFSVSQQNCYIPIEIFLVLCQYTDCRKVRAYSISIRYY